jgi:hypothetical protein
MNGSTYEVDTFDVNDYDDCMIALLGHSDGSLELRGFSGVEKCGLTCTSTIPYYYFCFNIRNQ